MKVRSSLFPFTSDQYHGTRPSSPRIQIPVQEWNHRGERPERWLVVGADSIWIDAGDALPLDALLEVEATDQDHRVAFELTYLDDAGSVRRRVFLPRCSPERAAAFWTEFSELVESRPPHSGVSRYLRELQARSCERCGDPDAAPASFMYVMCFLIFNTWKKYQVRLCRPCTTRRGLKELAKSSLLGWWGFPWGLMTFGAIFVNLTTLVRRSSLHPVLVVLVLPLALGIPLTVGAQFLLGRLARPAHQPPVAAPAARPADALQQDQHAAPARQQVLSWVGPASLHVCVRQPMEVGMSFTDGHSFIRC